MFHVSMGIFRRQRFKITTGDSGVCRLLPLSSLADVSKTLPKPTT